VEERGAADDRLDTPEGPILLYKRLQTIPTKKYMVAVCQHHRNCEMSRTCKNEYGASDMEGRPAGMLYAFLNDGHAAVNNTQHHLEFTPDYDVRSSARVALKKLPGAERFLQEERKPLRTGEPEEPIGRFDSLGKVRKEHQDQGEVEVEGKAKAKAKSKAKSKAVAGAKGCKCPKGVENPKYTCQACRTTSHHAHARDKTCCLG
jgi:hypothetical protein